MPTDTILEQRAPVVRYASPRRAGRIASRSVGITLLVMLSDIWQARYRGLLHDRVRLNSNIEKSIKNYAQAQRRNYPRGGAREQFRIDAEDARNELAATEEAIEQILVDARRAGVRPGWLYEVEDEPIEASRSAAPASTEVNSKDDEDRAGRNPIYFQDDDDY
jgi:hypothetical protein